MTSQEYYSPTSYRPDQIPDQPASQARGLYQKFSCTRLPWGSTQELEPSNLMNVSSPENMRRDEKNRREKAEQLSSGTYKPTLFDKVDFHQKYDHEHIRLARLPLGSQAWLILGIIGKFGAITLSAILFIIGILTFDERGETDEAIKSLIESQIFIAGPFAFFWLISHVIVNYFPKIWFRPPKGPLWDLNRRTGLVTLYDYKAFKKTGVIGEVSAPFYEFDAYIHTSPDRQGSPLNVLFLMHRYRDIRVKVGALLGAEQTP
ncbi:hypothetical protein, partial [Pseudomonas citronellolis]|uniref:hypothetical protein n=1 Tax=Pseudomonas citronellolis TaxID=53408 RepID=UPI0018D91352